MKFNIGNTVVVVICALTVVLFAFSKQNFFEYLVNNPLLSTSQLFSLLGTSLFAFSFVLSSRTQFVNKLFYGLDKVYRTHHTIGIIGFLLLLNHPIFLIIRAIINKLSPTMYFLVGSDPSYNAGIYALYLLTFLIIFAAIIRLAYPTWKNIHKFMGIALVLGFMHINTITSDVSRFPLLRFWIVTLLILGLISYIYKLFLYDYFPRPKKTKIAKVIKKGNVVEIYLKPLEGKIPFEAGQYFFLKFLDSKVVSKEEHPFSVSSSLSDELLRFSIKNLGDFTSKLMEIEEGVRVDLRGPFGTLLKGITKKKTDLVFIAGGIGITPFLSVFPLLKDHKNNVVVAYLTKNLSECLYMEEINAHCLLNKNLCHINHLSDQTGHMDSETLLKNLKSFENKDFYICGPEKMMSYFVAELSKNGVKSSFIHLENFNFI